MQLGVFQMTVIPDEIILCLSFCLPPLLGAFIGYVTNRVAIKMLFRPLKTWKVFGIRVPMTPGVIPAKRHELALNIGEMVGEHLLTSKEIGGALEKSKFQNHLYELIKERVEKVLTSDLGPLSVLIPNKYHSYFNTSVTRVTSYLQKNIHDFIHSEIFARKVKNNIHDRFDTFIENDVDNFFNKEIRESSYTFIETNLSRMMSSRTMEQWVEDYVHQKVHGALRRGMSCDDLLPDSLKKLILYNIEQQTPALLIKFAEILKEPKIQDKIVGGVKEGVDNFIESLGPMSAMVNNFLSTELVEEKVREYLNEKENDIVDWLQNDEVQERVAKTLHERAVKYLQTPLRDIIPQEYLGNVTLFCNVVSSQIVGLLREESTTKTLTTMIYDNLEVHIQSDNITIREALIELGGEDSVDTCRLWINNEVLSLLRSDESLATIDSMVEAMLASLLSQRIGKLANILPVGVRDGMYDSIRKMASQMLAMEVPGLVDSLNLRHIVAEKVDSLDLFRLERLLLSIMEEQFKYINLFGALLGFIIGCCNLVFIHWL